MITPILLKTYTEPPIDRKEILRYAGCKEADGAVSALLEECLQEAQKELSYRVCYQVLPLRIEGSSCDFDGFVVRSKKLAQNLAGCQEAVLFAATLGVGLDRLIGKYIRISPAKAMMLDAIGTERIEALCDAFCKDLGVARPRFSPGYGDLKLEVQKELIALLDCPRKINLCLTDHLMMSPSKSVTAFAGFGGGEKRSEKCNQCSKKDCEFRRS
jgi:hypothetical protein